LDQTGKARTRGDIRHRQLRPVEQPLGALHAQSVCHLQRTRADVAAVFGWLHDLVGSYIGAFLGGGGRPGRGGGDPRLRPAVFLRRFNVL
jgi:hypothetical protein